MRKPLQTVSPPQTGFTFRRARPKRTCRLHPPPLRPPKPPATPIHLRAHQCARRSPQRPYSLRLLAHPSQTRLKPPQPDLPPLRHLPPAIGCNSRHCHHPKSNPQPPSPSLLPAQPKQRNLAPPQSSRSRRPDLRLCPRTSPMRKPLIQRVMRPAPMPRQTPLHQAQSHPRNSYSKALSSRATRCTAALLCLA